MKIEFIVFKTYPIHFEKLVDNEIVFTSEVYDSIEECISDAKLKFGDNVILEFRDSISFILKDKDQVERINIKFLNDDKNILAHEIDMERVLGYVVNKQETSDEIKGNFTVNVFYGTDRKRTGKSDFNEFYGSKRGSLELGVCVVNIPDKKFGDIPRPKWWKLEFEENPNDHVMILELNVKDKNEFYSLLSDKVNLSSKKSAFLFIHGYNVEFEEACWRTAQMAYDLSFDGAPIMYSWPSNGSLKGYTGDEDNVKWTVPHFSEFVKGIIDSGIEKLHIISHSMGNRALADMIKEVVAFYPERPTLFSQIILAAPDIDSEIFIRDIAPLLKKTCKRVTLYASDSDKALMASRVIHNGILRAGQSGQNMVIIDGMDTIDASNIDTDLLGHGYFAATAPLINDIFHLIKNEHTPEDRNLRKNTSPFNKTFWKFPEGI